jgi:hypothetical protein
MRRSTGIFWRRLCGAYAEYVDVAVYAHAEHTRGQAQVHLRVSVVHCEQSVSTSLFAVNTICNAATLPAM